MNIWRSKCPECGRALHRFLSRPDRCRACGCRLKLRAPARGRFFLGYVSGWLAVLLPEWVLGRRLPIIYRLPLAIAITTAACIAVRYVFPSAVEVDPDPRPRLSPAEQAAQWRRGVLGAALVAVVTFAFLALLFYAAWLLILLLAMVFVLRGVFSDWPGWRRLWPD